MPLVLVGLSHHLAPIDVRERFSCSDHALPRALAAIKACPDVAEVALLSTCNRMEVYAQFGAGDANAAFDALTRHLAAYHQVPVAAFRQCLVCKAEDEAAAHLLRVASGLDSLVLGEAQILGQVRTALRVAQQAETARTVLNQLFQTALAGGKRVQSETGLGRGARSVAGAAVGFASQIFDLSHASVLLLGAGKTSELTARHLVQSGVRLVVVANRTHERAVTMAARLGGRAIHFDSFLSELVTADIVLSSTAAPHPIVTREILLPVLKKRKGKPLFFIDIALPRDIAADVGDLDNVFLYNIDDLQQAVASESGTRIEEASCAEAIVVEEAAKFMAWYRSRTAVPVITQLQSHMERLTQERLEILKRRIGPISERDWREIETQMRSLMQAILREPIKHLKAAAGQETSGSSSQYDLASAAQALFGLDTAPLMEETG